MSVTHADPPAAVIPFSTITLLPIMGAVLLAFLIIGLALPVLPLHVHQGLGFGTFVVGLVAGAQFAASLISRVWSGHFADSRGGKHALLAGLAMAAASGLLYLLSLRFVQTPVISAAILVVGRALLGGAESFIITGAVSWGLGLAGAQSAGRVIAWMGMAMFAAFALGAPIGSTLYTNGGFNAVALATTIIPMITIALVAPLTASPPRGGERPSLFTLIGAVWMPGVASALSSVGFGAIIVFGSLVSADRGWSPVWLLFSAFAASLVIVRLTIGHLPDRLGGAKVALVSVLIEAAGLALIWLAPDRVVASVGAVMTGAGFALIYPGLGVEAVRRTPPQSRGLAMGAYTAFLDVALGLGSPSLGLIAAGAGLRAVFLASAVIVLSAGGFALKLLRSPVAG